MICHDYGLGRADGGALAAADALSRRQGGPGGHGGLEHPAQGLSGLARQEHLEQGAPPGRQHEVRDMKGRWVLAGDRVGGDAAQLPGGSLGGDGVAADETGADLVQGEGVLAAQDQAQVPGIAGPGTVALHGRHRIHQGGAGGRK